MVCIQCYVCMPCFVDTVLTKLAHRDSDVRLLICTCANHQEGSVHERLNTSSAY